jgi:hypothetical protein
VQGWLGLPPATISDSIRAYYSASNTKPTLGCNLAENICRGYEFFLQNPNTNWHDNTMTNNSKGYVLNAAVIGTQGSPGYPSGNIWTPGGWGPSIITGPWQTYTMGSLIPTSSTLYVKNGISTNPTINQNSHGIGAFTYSNVNGITLTTPITEYIACPAIGSPLNSNDSLNESIAQQAIHYTDNIIPNNWMGQNKLWEAMMLDSSMADSSVVLSVFQSLAQNSRYAYLSALQNQLITGNFDSARIMLSYNIDSMANTSIDTITQVRLADNIGADNIIENYMSFCNLYMKFVLDSLSGSDSLSIISLANLCPQRNGTVVYQARALYSFIYNDLSIFNDDSCIDADTSYIASRQSFNSNNIIDSINIDNQNYNIYPNPNNGLFILTEKVSDGLPVNARILNSIGMTVFSGELIFDINTCLIEMRFLPKGIYLMRITSYKNKNVTIKFVID